MRTRQLRSVLTACMIVLALNIAEAKAQQGRPPPLQDEAGTDARMLAELEILRDLEMLRQLEDSIVVDPDALEDPVAVEQTVVEHADGRVRRRAERAAYIHKAIHKSSP